jgi:L-aminopeptidase/D-esterase-like protein
VRLIPALAILIVSLLSAVSTASRITQQTPVIEGRPKGPPHTSADSNLTLTAVDGLKVGHFTLSERPTGCTVVLADAGAIAGVDVRGAAPGTRETDLLSPVNSIEKVHAIVLAGGSAFGLDAASGVMRWLEEHRIGFDVGVARVPIVPAAILFDLRVGDPRIRPAAECGYRAAEAATTRPVQEGSIGAGAGATVGHARGPNHAMKSGIGSAAIRLSDGLIVAALAAVNAYGDVIDPASGEVVAGAREDDGKRLADVRRLMRGGMAGGRPGENTTLVIVATNAALTKTQASKVAQMAHDGLARAIWPVHTPVDGDTAFALATGTLSQPADLLRVGALAADVTADAIVRAARNARGLPGLPAAADLAPSR